MQTVRKLWGNSKFQYVYSESVGALGGILCVWDPVLFVKKHFVILEGSWTPAKTNIMLITVYVPQDEYPVFSPLRRPGGRRVLFYRRRAAAPLRRRSLFVLSIGLQF
ncbi:hypothetical protein LXL04_035347 [Taraxacum kok-saghyz]